MKGMYIPPNGWLETLLYGPVDDLTAMMTPRAESDDEYQYGASWTDRSRERIDEMVERFGSREEVLDRIDKGYIGFSSDWKGDVLHYLRNPGSGGSSSGGQGPNDDDGQSSSGGGSQPSQPQPGQPQPSQTHDREESRPERRSRYRDDDDDYNYSRRRTVTEPPPEPSPSAFATGAEGYEGDDTSALDPEKWGEGFADEEDRVLLQGAEEERRAFLNQEREAERGRSSKERQDKTNRRDDLYDALWSSESTQELTREQLELLYAQVAGLREAGVSGGELYEAINQSEVVAGMNDAQFDTLLRDVGVMGAGVEDERPAPGSDYLRPDPSQIGPYAPDPSVLFDRDPGPDADEQVDLPDGFGKPAPGADYVRPDPSEIGPYAPDPGSFFEPEPGPGMDNQRLDLDGSALAGELERLKEDGGGVWRRDPGTGDMVRVPDDEVRRQMERPYASDPSVLFDRDPGPVIDDRRENLLDQYAKAAGAEGGAVDPFDIGPDAGGRMVDTGEGVRRRMLAREGGDVEERENLLDQYEKAARAERGLDPFDIGPDAGGRMVDTGEGVRRRMLARDAEGIEAGEIESLGELERLKEDGGGVWRRDPGTGDMVRVPDDEVRRWMERPHVPDPTRLLDRERARADIEERMEDLDGSALAGELERLKEDGGGVFRRDPGTGEMVRVPGEEVRRQMEWGYVSDPTVLLDRDPGPVIEERENLLDRYEKAAVEGGVPDPFDVGPDVGFGGGPVDTGEVVRRRMLARDAEGIEASEVASLELDRGDPDVLRRDDRYPGLTFSQSRTTSSEGTESGEAGPGTAEAEKALREELRQAQREIDRARASGTGDLADAWRERANAEYGVVYQQWQEAKRADIAAQPPPEPEALSPVEEAEKAAREEARQARREYARATASGTGDLADAWRERALAAYSTASAKWRAAQQAVNEERETRTATAEGEVVDRDSVGPRAMGGATTAGTQSASIDANNPETPTSSVVSGSEPVQGQANNYGGIGAYQRETLDRLESMRDSLSPEERLEILDSMRDSLRSRGTALALARLPDHESRMEAIYRLSDAAAEYRQVADEYKDTDPEKHQELMRLVESMKTQATNAATGQIEQRDALAAKEELRRTPWSLEDQTSHESRIYEGMVQAGYDDQLRGRMMQRFREEPEKHRELMRALNSWRPDEWGAEVTERLRQMTEGGSQSAEPSPSTSEPDPGHALSQSDVAPYRDKESPPEETPDGFRWHWSDTQGSWGLTNHGVDQTEAGASAPKPTQPPPAGQEWKQGSDGTYWYTTPIANVGTTDGQQQAAAGSPPQGDQPQGEVQVGEPSRTAGEQTIFDHAQEAGLSEAEIAQRLEEYRASDAGILDRVNHIRANIETGSVDVLQAISDGERGDMPITYPGADGETVETTLAEYVRDTVIPQARLQLTMREVTDLETQDDAAGTAALQAIVNDPVRGRLMRPVYATDENGDLIQSRDANGKPVTDVEGNPVYETKNVTMAEYIQDHVLPFRYTEGGAITEKNAAVAWNKNLDDIKSAQEVLNDPDATRLQQRNARATLNNLATQFGQSGLTLENGSAADILDRIANSYSHDGGPAVHHGKLEVIPRGQEPEERLTHRPPRGHGLDEDYIVVEGYSVRDSYNARIPIIAGSTWGGKPVDENTDPLIARTLWQIQTMGSKNPTAGMNPRHLAKLKALTPEGTIEWEIINGRLPEGVGGKKGMSLTEIAEQYVRAGQGVPDYAKDVQMDNPLADSKNLSKAAYTLWVQGALTKEKFRELKEAASQPGRVLEEGAGTRVADLPGVSRGNAGGYDNIIKMLRGEKPSYTDEEREANHYLRWRKSEGHDGKIYFSNRTGRNARWATSNFSYDPKTGVLSTEQGDGNYFARTNYYIDKDGKLRQHVVRWEEEDDDDDGGGGGGGTGEAHAAIGRALQELRNKGASVEELNAAERSLSSVVGDGSTDQQRANIAKIKELTRGQVWTDTGGGYEQTDPDAIVEIGIDRQGNIVGSTTSREIPDTPWDTFLKQEEARLVAENEARRAGDPNNPIDQQAAAFRELQEIAGPEGFSSAEFEAYVSTGRLPDHVQPDAVAGAGPGGAQPAGDAQLLSAGPDLPAPAGGPDARVRDATTLSATGGLNPAAMAAIGVQETGTELHDVTTIGEQRAQEEAERAWAADASAFLESQGIDTSEMTDAQMAALIDPVDASAQRQHERDVAAAQSDQMGYLESKGYDPETIEGMSQHEIDQLVDTNVASDLQAVAAAQSDQMGYLESKGYDPETIEGMSQNEIDQLVDTNVASDQAELAKAQSDQMGYLEFKGYDPDVVEGMSQAEISRLVETNVASDRAELAKAQQVQLPPLGEFDGSDLGGLGEVGYSLENPELRDQVVENILDQVVGRMDAKDIGMLGASYGQEGVEDYVAGIPVPRPDGLTDPEYVARVEKRNQDAREWAAAFGTANTTVYAIDFNDPRNANLVQGDRQGAKDWFRPQSKSDGTRETAQEWANRVVNQGDLDPSAVAMLGAYLYPEGTGATKTWNDVSQPRPMFGTKANREYIENLRQTADIGRELTWTELAQRESGQRRFGEGVITAAEIASTLVGTAGAFRAPMIAKSVAGASGRLGRGAAAGFRGVSRVPGLGRLSSPGAQNFAAKATDTVVQGGAEAVIDVGLGVVAPLEPMEALTPERIAQLTAFEIGAEAATNLARFGSGRFGLTGLGDAAKVGFEDIPLTGWGGRTGIQRTAYIEGAIERNPSLADDFFVVRDETGRAVMVQPRTEVARGLVAESRAFTRIRDGMASGMTDEGLARIARREGLADPEEFVARVKNVADTGQSGLFQVGGRPTFTFGNPPGASPLVAPAAGIPTPTAGTVTQSDAPAYQPIPAHPGVPVAYTPPGRPTPSSVAGQHDPSLPPSEIATLIVGQGTPTTQLTFAPTPAEGVTNAPPTTVTTFVTAQPAPPAVPTITGHAPGTVPPVVTPILGSSTPTPVTQPPAVTPILGGPTPVTQPPTVTPVTQPPAVTPILGGPTPVTEPPTVPPGEPPTGGPTGGPTPPTAPPTVPPGEPPTGGPTGGPTPPTAPPSPPGEPPSEPGDPPPPGGGETEPEPDPEKEPEKDGEKEPPGEGRTSVGVGTSPQQEWSAMSAATPGPRGRASGLLPFPFPPGAGVPVLPFGGFRRGAGGAMLREGNPRIVQWRQRTKVVADLDTGKFTEMAVGPPTGVIITMKDQTAPAPHVRLADTMEVTPGETWVEIFPRPEGKTSEASESNITSEWVGGQSAKAENPRVVSWEQSTLLTHDLDEGTIVEQALGQPAGLQVLSSDRDAPSNNRRFVDVMEIRPTAEGVAVRPRAMPKVSRERRKGGKPPKRTGRKATAGRVASAQKR